MITLRRTHVAVALTLVGLAVGTAGVMASHGSASPPASPGTLEVGPDATVTDSSTKQSSSFGLRASTNGGAPSGDVVLQLGRGARNFEVCTVHGPEAQVDFTNNGNETGNDPYPDIQCGRAYGESVSFNKCTMTAQSHAFMHADAPDANYLGPTTVTITFS